jgi:triphosphoribosyl-dephospho-CoA synthase
VIPQLQYSRDRLDVVGLDPPSLVNYKEYRSIGLTALNSLYQELCAYPKPGLVSLVDNGSHQDMDACTFLRSLFSLKAYFRDVALVGSRNACYEKLRCLGIMAESRMLRATGNANTHRGAIFSLGLIAAAAGLLSGRGQSLEEDALGRTIRERWGDDILLSAPGRPCSHGTMVAAQYGVSGARQEAAAGFPHLFNVGLPALEASLSQRINLQSAIIQCFFHLMAVLPDSNLLYRGGPQGLRYAQSEATSFLTRGGAFRKNWRVHARAIHHQFIARNLSPGGSADLLAASLFVHQLQKTQALKPLHCVSFPTV